MSGWLSIALRRRRLVMSVDHRREWASETSTERVEASAASLIVCDMWDRHWSSGAASRVELLAPRVDEFCRRMRSAGVLIVHAPSETVGAYRDGEARARVPDCAQAQAVRHLELPPLPVTCDNGGSDTDDEYPPDTAVWTRQHPAIWIDEGVDGISDDRPKIASYLIANKRQVVLMVGVHANLCVLDRSFGLPALVGFGLQPVLVSDLRIRCTTPRLHRT